MSRLLCLMGLVVFAGLGVAGCHSNGPPGGDQMPDPMDPMNPMFRVPTAAHGCNAPSMAAKCAQVKSL